MINFDIFVNGIQKTIFLHHYNFLTENYVDVSVVAILQAAGVFVMIKYLNDPKLQNNRILKRIHNSKKFNYSVMTISRACYGVYLLNQSLLLILTTFVDISFLDNFAVDFSDCFFYRRIPCVLCRLRRLAFCKQRSPNDSAFVLRKLQTCALLLAIDSRCRILASRRKVRILQA